MNIFNLLYLAKLSSRITLLPEFDPPFAQLPNAEPLSVGKMFNLDKFVQSTGLPHRRMV